MIDITALSWGLVAPAYIDAGAGALPGIENHIKLHKIGRAGSADDSWMTLHLELGKQIAPAMKWHDVASNQDLPSTVIDQYVEVFKRVSKRFSNLKELLTLALAFADKYAEPILNKPKYKTKGEDQRYALEALLFRAIEGLRAAKLLVDAGFSDCFLLLGTVQEALLLLRKVFKEPKFLKRAQVRAHLDELEKLRQWRELLKKRKIERPAWIEEIAQHKIESLSKLGLTVSDDWRPSSSSSIPKPYYWKDLVSSDTPLKGETYKRYWVIFQNRNRMAHSRPTSFGDFVSREKRRLRVQKPDPTAQLNLDTMIVMKEFIEALRLLRPAVGKVAPPWFHFHYLYAGLTAGASSG